MKIELPPMFTIEVRDTSTDGGDIDYSCAIALFFGGFEIKCWDLDGNEGYRYHPTWGYSDQTEEATEFVANKMAELFKAL